MQERALYAALSACVLHAEGGLAGALTSAPRGGSQQRAPRWRHSRSRRQGRVRHCARFGSSPRPLRRGRGADRADRLDPARPPAPVSTCTVRTVPGPSGGGARRARRRRAGLQDGGRHLPRARPDVPDGSDRARARRVARRPGTRRRGGAAARGGARDLRAARGDAVARARERRRARTRRCRHDLRELRHRERAGPEVLRRVRRRAGRRLPRLRRGELAGTRSSAASAARR